MLAFHEQPEEIVTYDLHVVHLQLIEPLRDKAAHYRLIVGVGRNMSVEPCVSGPPGGPSGFQFPLRGVFLEDRLPFAS